MRELSIKLGWWCAGLTWAGVLMPFSWWWMLSAAGLVCLFASLGTAWLHAHRELKRLRAQS